ncbi:MAG: TolC family protein [Candidatus Binatia bacterium]|nr:TolC family protein [Candidatus Binatia bacterium]
MRLKLGTLTWAAMLVAVALPVFGEEAALLSYQDEQALAALLWARAAEVLDARTALRQAESAHLRARTYPNPSIDGSWNTIPVGRTNPPGLPDRLNQIPNYSVVFAQLFELGKRGPRIAARAFDVERLRAEAEAVLGDRFFALLDTIGRIATEQRRSAVLDQQIRDSEELLQLDRARADRGEIPALDVDVAEVEQARLRALRESAQAALLQAQSECSALLAMPCPQFADDEAAKSFLVRSYQGVAGVQPSVDLALELRPDLKALRAAIAAAEQDAVLAERRAVPDVTLRAGYTYDQFTVAGNQRNSLVVGFEMPIPLFDRGQADLIAARAVEARARELLRVLTESLPDRLKGATEQLGLALRRMEQLDRAVTKASAMRDTLVEAQRAGGISAIEVLVARRNYQDLLRERVELDGDAFSAALTIRKLSGQFPTVSTEK